MKSRRCFTEIPSSATSDRRGAMAVLISLLLIVFLAGVAFSVDVAYMHLVRTELQISTDAAARAAGESLTRTQDLEEAYAAARQMAAANPVATEPLLLDDDDIIPGHSELSDDDGRWTFDPDGTPINSIRVNGRRTRQAPSGSVALYFGRVFNHSDYEVVRTATVVRLDRDLCIVVDRSSSMKLDVDTTETGLNPSTNPLGSLPPQPDSRWMALATAVTAFTEALEITPQVEWVGLVSYASDYTFAGVTNNVVDIDQNLTEDSTLINTALGEISARVFNGNTDIAAGLNTGVQVLTDPVTSRQYAVKTILLMTDGVPTSGGDVLTAAQAAAAQNVTIHTVTFGAGADQDLMLAVADATGGIHFHALSAEELQAVFRKIALTVPVTFAE